MNIKIAKEQIRNTVKAYLVKDINGDYCIPIDKQRPVFINGAPGIGKTAILGQIASEIGVGLISYSMTHHTRQSAMGLPVINHKKYGEQDFTVTEYTMSEIIASVYDYMETTGIREGILFLDEINCVSETLAPLMLQFLQFKTFGQHRLPEGWVVVTAGNPPEYNDSVHEFDVSTSDRLKIIDVEPNYDVWREYANNIGIHPSILAYLDSKKGDFYTIQTTIDGKRFVTARGWTDLSVMVRMYEHNNITIDKNLISQYVHDPRIVTDFSIYYDLFTKYRGCFQIDKIIEGDWESLICKAEEAAFDERVALVELLNDSIKSEIREFNIEEKALKLLPLTIKEFTDPSYAGLTPVECLNKMIDITNDRIAKGKKRGSMDSREIYARKTILRYLNRCMEQARTSLDDNSTVKDAIAILRGEYESLSENNMQAVDRIDKHLTNSIEFIEEAYGDGRELLMYISDLSTNEIISKYLIDHTNKKYIQHCRKLLLADRQKELAEELKAM